MNISNILQSIATFGHQFIGWVQSLSYSDIIGTAGLFAAIGAMIYAIFGYNVSKRSEARQREDDRPKFRVAAISKGVPEFNTRRFDVRIQVVNMGKSSQIIKAVELVTGELTLKLATPSESSQFQPKGSYPSIFPSCSEARWKIEKPSEELAANLVDRQFLLILDVEGYGKIPAIGTRGIVGSCS